MSILDEKESKTMMPTDRKALEANQDRKNNR